MNEDTPYPTPEERDAVPVDPDHLEDHLEEGMDEAAEHMRRMLRYGGSHIRGLTDSLLLAYAVEVEKATREWPPDVLSGLLGFVYRAEIRERARVSVETDRKRVFARMARKAGFHIHEGD